MAEATLKLKAVDQTQAAIRSATNGLRGLNSTAKLLRGSLGAIGVASIGAFLIDTAKQATLLGDQINKASSKAGIATDVLAELAYAAKLNGVELQPLVKSLQFMQKGLVEAAMGTGEAKRGLDVLGVSINDLKGLRPEEQFRFFAEAISQIEDPSRQSYVALRLFGEAGLELLPILTEGATALDKLTEEARRLYGTSFTKENLDRVTEQKDAADKLRIAWDAFALTITSKVSPALTKLFNQLSGVAKYDPSEIIKSQIANYRVLEGQFRFAGNQKLADDAAEIAKAYELQLSLLNDIKSEQQAIIDQDISDKLLTEVQITSRKRAMPLEDFYKTADFERVRVLYAALESMENAVSDAASSAANNLENITADISDTALDNFQVLENLASAAAQNIQTSFANFLFDPFSNGLKGMLKGFVDTIRRMIAEIAASMILTKFFSWMGDLGGFWGKVGMAATTALTGKAMGGSVQSSKPYLVGERGPELFVPGSNGSIVPNDKMGGTTIAPVYNIDARGATADLQKSLPGILAENNRRIFDELDRRYGIGR